jgi:glycosyltransferase involved in cell wall biosynthesis
MKIKLAYIVWNEAIINNNIFKNQVLDQLNKLNDLYKDDLDITLIVSFPVTSYVLKYRSQHKPYKDIFLFLEELKRRPGFRIIVLKSYLGFNFNTRYYLLPFQYIENVVKLFFLQIRHRFQLFHCRSYHATFAALMCRRLTGGAKVIFDTRGKFPEEGIFRKKYSESGLSYKVWKRVERFLMKRADAVVNVSDTFTLDMIEQYPFVREKSFTIYTSTNTNFINRKPTRDYPALQGKNGLVFIGEVSAGGPYSIMNIIGFYEHYRAALTNPALVIITNEDHAALKKVVMDCGLAGEVHFHSTSNYEESYNILYYCKFGFAILNTGNEALMKYLSPTIISSKTGDYLCAGLPLIYHKAIGGAAYIIEHNGVGITFDFPVNPQTLSRDLKMIATGYDALSEKCKQFAEDRFGSVNNAKRYYGIYSNLLSSR